MTILPGNEQYAAVPNLVDGGAFAEAVEAALHPLRVFGVTESHAEHDCGGACDDPDLDFIAEGAQYTKTYYRWSSADGAITNREV